MTKKVIVNNLATSYKQYGNKKVYILLLHGWGDNCTTFTEISNSLSNEYSLIALDLPGFGDTESPQDAWGLHEYANFVADFCNKINISPRVIIGHSNGGAIAISAVSNGIIKPNKLVLLASAGIRSKSIKKSTQKNISHMVKPFLKILPNKSQIQIKKSVYSKIGSDYYVAEHLQESFKKITSQDVQEIAKNIKIPTLLIYGYKDTSTPIEYGKKLQLCIKDSKLLVVKDAGHFVYKDDLDFVVNNIRDFINA